MPPPLRKEISRFQPGEVVDQGNVTPVTIPGEFRPRQEQPIRYHHGMAIVANPETGQAERDIRVYGNQPGFVSSTPPPETALGRLLQAITHPIDWYHAHMDPHRHESHPTPGSAPQVVNVPADPASRLQELLTAVDRHEIPTQQAVEMARQSGADQTALAQFLETLGQMQARSNQ